MSQERINLDELDSKLCSLMKLAGDISAVPKSLYSDTQLDADLIWVLSMPKRYRSNCRALIANLIILSLKKPYWYDYFLLEVEQICYDNSYQGQWETLHWLCCCYHYNLILVKLEEFYTGSEFFGNIYPVIELELERPSINFVQRQKPTSRRIQRRRGYNDHGSMRHPHEIHSEATVSGPNRQKLDLRNHLDKNLILRNFLLGGFIEVGHFQNCINERRLTEYEERKRFVSSKSWSED